MTASLRVCYRCVMRLRSLASASDGSGLSLPSGAWGGICDTSADHGTVFAFEQNTGAWALASDAESAAHLLPDGADRKVSSHNLQAEMSGTQVDRPQIIGGSRS